MSDDFLENLTSLTNNLQDIAFTRYVTVANINSDGTVDCRDDEGTIHKNIKTNSFMDFKVGEIVILGFVDNNIYEPFIICSKDIKVDYDDLRNKPVIYTKTEVNILLEDLKNSLLNRLNITSDITVIQSDMVCDVKAYFMKDGVPFKDKTVYFYIMEEEN